MQIFNANFQSFVQLEKQLDWSANTISEREKESFLSLPIEDLMPNQSNLNILEFNKLPFHSTCEVDTIHEMSNNYVHNDSTHFIYADNS